ncbi:hypothetical protein L3D22_07340 [Lysobacter soli]|uniref:CheR family methyltransferase n=1 Tax=Lysobacter soli TaxID=453783 RepID=UPI0020A1B2A1|nr:CheR family methyltransferase [Lysobacter soli]UTA55607.1 hypothetical protein L3D22_07340 [Lysobacter soli]
MNLLLTGVTRVARPIWNRLPSRIVNTHAFLMFGRFMHRHHIRYQDRHQSHVTRFLRNLPQLNVVCALLNEGALDPLSIASVGCSTGAELYSAIWLMQARMGARAVKGLGVDISDWAIAAAREARYPRGTRPDVDMPAEVSGLTEVQSSGLFEDEEGVLCVRGPIRDACSWIVGDVRDSNSVETLGQHDVVMANNFLGPMADDEATACLQGLMKLVKPGRYLVVEGIDLDVKSRVLGPAGWHPVIKDLEPVYFADYWKRGWPWIRWGHEPIDRQRADWRVRYSTIYQAPGDPAASLQKAGLTAVSAPLSSARSPAAAKQ